MLQRLRKPVAFLSAVVMTLTLLLYLPVGIFTNDYGSLAVAEETTTDDNGFLEDGSYEPAVQITANNYKKYGFTAGDWETYMGYYAIENAGQLYWFADKVNNTTTYCYANVVLTADIVVNDDITNETDRKEWTPIGNSSKSFKGTFDGQGHKISGLYYYNTSTSYVGLFGHIYEAEVKNVGVVDSSFTAKDCIGGIAGCCYYYSKIINCYSSCSIASSNETEGEFGGIAGHCSGSTIKGCYNTGDITVSENYTYAGGIAGYLDNYNSNYGVIEECYNTGTISSSSYVKIGGIAGQNNGTIKKCYNTGKITGGTNSSVGGITGINSREIDFCYNTGTIECTTSINGVGGIVGRNIGSISNCYNIGSISCSSSMVGAIAGYNDGNYIKNCFATSDSFVGDDDNSDNTINMHSCTAAQFESGEVAYLLQGELSENVWGQNLGEDKSPTLGGPKVVYGENCEGEYAYFNEGMSGHILGNDFKCINCGKYPSATLVDSSNCTSLGLTSDYEGYYAISNAGQLYWFAQEINANKTLNINAVLLNDIIVNKDITDTDNVIEWTMIDGHYEDEETGDYVYYSGTFDGQGHTISGLYYNNSEKDNIALFYYIAEKATIKDLGIINTSFSCRTSTGSFAVCNNYGTIENCYFKGELKAQGSYTGSAVGGITSYNYGTIKKCYNEGTLTSSKKYADNVGGITSNNDGIVEECYNKGDMSVNSSGAKAGGIVAYNTSKVKNCYNTGKVSSPKSDTELGGVVGNNKGEVINCYNASELSTNSSSKMGGVVGYNYGTTSNIAKVTNCYFDSNIYTGNEVGYIDTDTATVTSVLGKTTTEFNSGEVAFLLQGDQTTTVWGQTLSGDKKQDYPVLGGKKVNSGTNCKGETAYSNYVFEDDGHSYDDDLNCVFCGEYQSAVLVTEDNYESLKLDKSYVGYYAISNASQLYWFADKVNNDNKTYGSAKAVLTNDIIVNDDVLKSDGTLNSEKASTFKTWFPIGYNYDIDGDGNTEDVYFNGVFDGQEHTISGLYFNNTMQSCVGLFGQIKPYVSIKNVGVVGSYFNVAKYVGGICGRVSNYASITNCYNTGNVTGSGYEVGGICGRVSAYASITNCYNTGNVTGSDDEVGGICGYASSNSKITNCYNTGDVTGSDDHVGGICGYVSTDVSITNCYNTGDVTGSNQYVGGICANVSSDASITNCYNTGDVTGSGYYVGGICGDISCDGSITNCYNTGDVTGSSNYVGGICGKVCIDALITNCYNTGDVTGNVSDVGGICGYNSGTITNCFYLTGCAKDGNNTVQNGVGNSTKGSTTDDIEGQTTGKSDFSDGEVAYFLQGDQTTTVWGQNIDNDKTKQDYPVLNGAKVYQNKTYANCSVSDNYTATYSNTQKEPIFSDVHTDENNDGFCDDCKINLDDTLKLLGYTLTLDGSIGVNFHMVLADEIAENVEAYVKFTVNNKEQIVKVSEATKTDDGYYVFPCKVAAPDMTMDIIAQLFSGDYKSIEYKFTVQDYAKYILEHSSEFENSETLVPLVKAMLNYGANAQTYFNKNTDKLANSILDKSDRVLNKYTAEDLSAYAPYTSFNKYTQGVFTSFYLNLNSVITLRAVFEPGEGFQKYFSLYPKGGSSTGSIGTTVGDKYYYEKDNGTYTVVLDNINILDLGTTYKFVNYYQKKVNISGKTQYLNITCSVVELSPLSYVYTVLNSETLSQKELLVNVSIALYDYYLKAVDYDNATNGTTTEE